MPPKQSQSSAQNKQPNMQPRSKWFRDPATRIAFITGLFSTIITLINALTN